MADDIGRADLDGSDPDPDFIDTGVGHEPLRHRRHPDAAATPAARNYGSLTVGTESDPEPFSIENTASSVLDVTSVTIIGADASQFKLAGDGCSPAKTRPG